MISKEWCHNRPKSGLIGIKTRKEQGTCPREIMVSLCFKHETRFIMTMDFLKKMKEELDKAADEINGNV